MRVVFRVDASLQMGTGHVMRCLTLADALQKQGSEISFICREHKGNLIKYIEKKGYVVYRLDILVSEKEEVNQPEINPLAHASWLGVTQREDAHACELILKNINPDWLIVDHYAIDCRWQNQLKKYIKKLMVIDDLADRKHECDLLLDQTFGRKEDSYNKLVPRDCKLLLGSQYALLRPEFSQWRKYSLQRRAVPELKNILISMGGIDQANVTGQILHILKTCILPKDLTLTVIVGAASPNIEVIKKIAKAMPNKTEVKVNVDNMAKLMANADLAIGAAGATTWERCCLGLPSIQIVVADNQMLIAKNLRESNIIQYVENLTDLQFQLKDIVKKFKKMSFLSSTVTNGCGSEGIVCDYLIPHESIDEDIILKPVDVDDCKYIYDLQTEDTRKYSRNPSKPLWEEHVKWFKQTMDAESSVLFIIFLEQQAVGVLRLDNIDKKEMEISIIVSPEYSGLGIAKRTLNKAVKLQPKGCFKATVHKENIPSQYVFEKIGFSRVGESGNFLQYVLSNC